MHIYGSMHASTNAGLELRWLSGARPSRFASKHLSDFRNVVQSCTLVRTYQACDPFLVSSAGPQRLAGGWVPQPDRTIHITTGDVAAIGGPGNDQHPVLVCLSHGHITEQKKNNCKHLVQRCSSHRGATSTQFLCACHSTCHDGCVMYVCCVAAHGYCVQYVTRWGRQRCGNAVTRVNHRQSAAQATAGRVGKPSIHDNVQHNVLQNSFHHQYTTSQPTNKCSTYHTPFPGA
jgi:hypothetical protein